MRSRITLMLLGSAVALLSAPAYAQSGGEEMKPSTESCIWLRQLDHAEVIDDQTILFFQTTDRIYRNRLPRECPGLEREGRFLYQVPTSRLCSVDTIAVLENFGGAGLTRGFTCALGEFQEVSEEEVEAMREAARRRGEADDGRD